MKNLKLLLAFAVLAAAALAVAMDSPHNGSYTTAITDCQSCHLLHNSPAGTLSRYPGGNDDGCLTCHQSVSAQSPSTFFAPNWSATGRQAQPGVSGDHHSWTASASGPLASLPTNLEMAKRVTAAGKLQCAVCHDVHGVKDTVPGSPTLGNPIQENYATHSAHSSIGLQTPRDPVVGSGKMMVAALDAYGMLAYPQAYAIKVLTGGPSGTYTISHDYESKGAAAATWNWVLNYSVKATDDPLYWGWLDDNGAVQIQFTSAPTAGSIWSFYVSFPFLRATNVADAMCTDCHANRVMGFKCVEGTDCTAGLGQVFSHPVGEALNDNKKSYDAATPLDADGSTTSSTNDGLADDGVTRIANPGNDLKVHADDGNKVRCTTCHAPHNAMSNSLTVEVR